MSLFLSRLSGVRVALLLFAVVPAVRSAADSTVVFNEIQYHPVTAESNLEWIELHNQMAVNMDISNWRLAGGAEFVFSEGTVVPGGGYLVVAINPTALIAATRLANVVGPFTGRLSNSGETLELRNNNQRLMDSVKYGTSGDWPVAPDGTGVTLAKLNPNLATAPATNWRLSAQMGGTPGTANFPAPSVAAPVPLIPSGSTWRVENSGLDPGTSWREPGFDDGGWASAPAPFHGGDAPDPGGLSKPIPTLFNTGVDSQGHVLAPGSPDPHYTVVASAEPVSPPPPAPALVIEGHPAWLVNDSASSWIGPVNPGTVNVAAGAYRYQAPFDLAGFDAATASIALSVSADNRLNDVLLNGASQGINFVGFQSFSRKFTLATGFVAGRNTLEFRWANDSASANPAGFRALVSGTARTLSAPESTLAPVRPVIYFRAPFVFGGNPAATHVNLDITFDDGAVVYLNGTEVFRVNLPAGPISAATPALVAVAEASTSASRVIDSGVLRAGTNVVAVELHQAAAGLNDAWFDLQLSAQPATAPSEMPVVFNEVSAGGGGFSFELASRTGTPVSLAGYQVVQRGASSSTFTFPEGTTIPAGGFLEVTGAQLGFQTATGDQLALVAPSGLAVADAVVVKKTRRGRSPDVTGPWLFPDVATPGASNAFAFHRDIVINEIFYHAHDSAPAGEWVELFNRGAQPANLSDWRFDSGIRFRFPAGTTIGAGGYLVVAKEPDDLRARHPGIVVVEPFTNSLSRRGERLVLSDAAGNPADEVHYHDAGRWPERADGGGSSLELRNPFADNSAPEAWAASGEAAAAGWSNYTYRATAVSSPGPTQWKEFVVGLLDAGECLVDDFKVIESPSGVPVSLLQNGDFETGATAWRFLGTHRLSRVVVDPENPSNHVLDLIATGPTEHMHNHLETTFAGRRSVVSGRTYEISFRAKWISGNNQLNTRLYFNRVARTSVLPVPSRQGTPGARNSTYEPNIGPTFANLLHSPAVPEANQPVTVSVEAGDPEGIASARVFWTANGGAWQDRAMVAQAGSVLGATLPGAAAGTVVQFYVQATDVTGATSTLPAAGPASRALYVVNDRRAAFGRLHNFRIIMTAADTTLLHAATNVMSNELLGATAVYDEAQVFYDVGVHLQGSQRGRLDGGRVGFTVRFAPDNLFRGVHDGLSIDRSGGYTGVGADQDEIVLKHVVQHAGGLAGMYDDLVRVIPPRTDLTGPGLLILAKYGKVFLDSQYDDGSDGSEFKLELIYSPTTTADGKSEGLKLPQPDNVEGVDLRNLGNDPEVYRWFFLQENNRSRNDYSQVIALAQAMAKSGTALDTEAHRLMDVSQWMRAVAFQTLFGLVDTYPFDNPHNFIIYFRPQDGRALPFLWDMDFNFGAAPSSPINRATGNLGRLMSIPGNQRVFLGHLLDIMTTTYNTNYMVPWLTHYGGLVGQNFGGIRGYVDQRVKSVRSQLPAAVAFSITSGPTDAVVNAPSLDLSGRAWINIREIRLKGRPEPVEFKWPNTTTWQVTVPLVPGTNRLEFLAYDFQGALVASNVVHVTSSAFGGGIDSDGDGLPDLWETAGGLNPRTPDSDFDTDRDGFTNREEFVAGTDPLDPASRPELAIATGLGGTRLNFLARAGRSYSIVTRDTTVGTTWLRTADIDPAVADHRVEVPVAGPPGASARFYRLVTPRLP